MTSPPVYGASERTSPSDGLGTTRQQRGMRRRRKVALSPLRHRRQPHASIAVLVKGWMGDKARRPPHQTSGAAQHPSGLAHCSSRLAVSLPSSVSRGGDPYDSPFAPVSSKMLPLLADTIGLLAPPQAGEKTPASSHILHPSTPAVASASAASGCCCSAPLSCVVVDLETTGFSPTADEILEVGCVELRWTPSSRTTLTGPKDADPCAPPLEKQGSCGVLEGLWTRGGRVFHRYVRPSHPRRITAAATAVHGITWEKVQHCASWPVVASELVAYMTLIRADALFTKSVQVEAAQHGGHSAVHLPPLVAHNALFDARFLAHHLQRCGYQIFWHPQYPLTCTRQWAQVAYPHLANNLDTLCAFLSIDGAADRATNGHGALTDATLTALLFLRMCCRWTERFGGGG